MSMSEGRPSVAERWALYLRQDDGDAAAILGGVHVLADMAAARGGVVTGIYLDVHPDAPELVTLLMHANDERVRHLAVVCPEVLGGVAAGAVLTIMCLLDLGVRLYAQMFRGEVYPAGRLLDFDDLAEAILGPGHEAADLVERLESRVGLAPHRPA